MNAINKKETLISENNYINHNILKNPKKDSLINEPFLPQNEEEINIKKYNKSYYNTSNIRYHFEDLFYYRKLFRINYSYLPYENVDKSKSYEYNANYIFETTGMLNITKLDQKYFNQKNADTLNFNHIHLSMGHDNNYILLSLVSIASILNTTNNNTFIHFHFVLLGSVYKDMKPIIALKKIYNNVEFIFYNGKQAEYDFYIYVIIFDSADIIALKDLSEIYYFDLEDNYFGFALDILAGRNHSVFVFAKNKFYSNIGICLVNVKRFRNDQLYMAGYFVRLAYEYLPCPTQEMFFLVSQFKFKFFPIIYNYPQFFTNEADFQNKIYNSSLLNLYLQYQNNSPFKYTLDEIIEAEKNKVINHLFLAKPFHNKASKKDGKIWVNYAKLANAYDKLKLKYPKTFELYDI